MDRLVHSAGLRLKELRAAEDATQDATQAINEDCESEGDIEADNEGYIEEEEDIIDNAPQRATVKAAAWLENGEPIPFCVRYSMQMPSDAKRCLHGFLPEHGESAMSMGVQLLDAISESDARERREAAKAASKGGGQNANAEERQDAVVAAAEAAAEAAKRRKALANAAKKNATSRYCAGVVHGARVDTVVAFAAGRKNHTHQIGKHLGLLPYGYLSLNVDAVVAEVGRVVSMNRSTLLNVLEDNPENRDIICLLRGTAVHDAVLFMKREGQPNHHIWGVEWNGREMPLLQSGEKMRKNTAMGTVLSVLSIMFVGAMNPDNHRTIRNQIMVWSTSKFGEQSNNHWNSRIAGDSVINEWAKGALTAECNAFNRFQHAVEHLWDYFCRRQLDHQPLDHSTQCFMLLNGACMAAFEEVATPDEAFRSKVSSADFVARACAAAEADVARVKRAYAIDDSVIMSFLRTPFDDSLLSVINKDSFIALEKDVALAAVHAVLRDGVVSIAESERHVHAECVTEAIMMNKPNQKTFGKINDSGSMNVVMNLLQKACKWMERIKTGVVGDNVITPACPLLSTPLEIRESALGKHGARLPPLFIALDAIASTPVQPDLQVAPRVVSDVIDAACEAIGVAVAANPAVANVAFAQDPVATWIAGDGVSSLGGIVDRRNRDAATHHVEQMDISTFLADLPPTESETDIGLRTLLSNMNKPFPGAAGKPVKIGIDYLQGAIFKKRYTKGRVFGKVSRKVGNRVTYKSGSRKDSSDKYHFVVGDEAQWAIVVHAVRNLIAEECSIDMSAKRNASIAKKGANATRCDASSSSVAN
jgi:hypothetical protein